MIILVSNKCYLKTSRKVGVGCQWPVGAIASIKNNELVLNSILLDKKGIHYINLLLVVLQRCEKIGLKLVEK